MKKNPLISYLTKISLFSIAICFVVAFLMVTVQADYIRNTPYYVFMYYVVTAGFWMFLYLVPKKGIMKFEQAYMITKTVKIIIYAAIFAIVLLCGFEKNTKFAIAYLGLYLVYMIFDVITLMQLVKQYKTDKK